mgnify:CR=1 FL=1
MGPNELSAAISAAEPLIRSMIALGLPGIVLLAAAIPALVIIVAFVMNYKHAKRMENIVEHTGTTRNRFWTTWAQSTRKWLNFTERTSVL